jgi:hypothetical protein
MISKTIRRTHLYLALFLGPWILMYSASTLVMNHRAWFRGDPAPPPQWKVISEDTYRGDFPPDAKREQMARQILDSLGMEGLHQTALRDGRLIINRLQPVHPMRLTYSVADKKLTVERQVWESAAFLERMHRRRGFQSPYVLEDVWAFSVDLFIAAVLFWALSGLWLWWELRATRTLGAWVALAGGVLFCFFLSVL